MPLFEGNPLTPRHKILSPKTRVLEAAHGKDFVILSCTVFDKDHECDRQTDRRTDRRTPRWWL